MATAVTVLGALAALALLTTGTAQAQRVEIARAQAQILPGSLSLIESPIAIGHEDDKKRRPFSVTVVLTDARGSGAGWHVQAGTSGGKGHEPVADIRRVTQKVIAGLAAANDVHYPFTLH